jgi:hypothetical protein
MSISNEDRFTRHISLFGKEGQAKLRAASVAIIGVGGLGTHVVQQLALLGVGHLKLVDGEELDSSNRNRYIGAYCFDPIPGSRKVILAARLAKAIDPEIVVETIDNTFVSERAFKAIQAADWVFGCLDKDGPRLILNELCAAYARPYVDLATEVIPEERPQYGGRVFVSQKGEGCLVCYDQVDNAEAQQQLSGPEGARQREAIYGVKENLLAGSGPSVVSLNGFIASLGVTEFMVALTGLRAPKPLQTYLGREARLTQPSGTKGLPHPDCYYCKGVFGTGSAADVERYVRGGYGEFIR